MDVNLLEPEHQAPPPVVENLQNPFEAPAVI